MHEKLKNNNILFVLIHIDEAHTPSGWPAGLNSDLEPQTNISERLERANNFAKTEAVPYPVYVDTWSNDFGEIFRAWPDKYYCIDSNYKVIAKAEYGSQGDEDALIVKDCTELIEELISEQK